MRKEGALEASVIRTLHDGRILGPGESAADMVHRVVAELVQAERVLGTPEREACAVGAEFATYLTGRDVVLSTPVLTNAGRYGHRALSGCVAAPVDLRGDLDAARQLVDVYHEHGMGAAYRLDDVADPVAVLTYLNEAAVAGARSGREDRPVGNIAILSDRHPCLPGFVRVKSDVDASGQDWRFNLSVNVSERFLAAVAEGASWSLADGSSRPAADLLTAMAQAAHRCGDPGVVFMERFQRDNPVPALGQYVTVGPCGESGLVLGEACHFGYINVANFLPTVGQGLTGMQFDRLGRVVQVLVRMLDNAVEVSRGRYPHHVTRSVVTAKRKIGVGVCGLADLFVRAGVSYGSAAARRIASDVLLWINYESKRASHELARHRGSFPAIDSAHCAYQDDQHLVRKYGDVEASTVTRSQWAALGRQIASTGHMRNAATVTIPPTGRSALLIRASAGIEPYFQLTDADGIVPSVYELLVHSSGMNPDIRSTILATGHVPKDSHLDPETRSILRTATELTADEHLAMAAAVGRCSDESASKTVNLPASATVDDVAHVFLRAAELGLKGVAVYRDGCRLRQPRPL